MAFSITCPECGATLKANKKPRPHRQLKCLKCEKAFTLADFRLSTPGAEREQPPRPPAVRRYFSEALVMPWVIVGLIGLVAIAGIAGSIYFASGPETPVIATKAAESLAEKPAPPPEPAPQLKSELKAEPKADVEADRRRQLFTHLMIDGGIATQLKKFDEAVSAYGDALKLFPEDETVKQKLADAQVGLKSQEQARREEEKLKAEIAALIQRGQDSLDRGQLPAAVDFFKLALERAPTNPEAAQKFLFAQNKLQEADAEKRKLEAFDEHILTGKAAMKAGRPGDAAREFAAAGKLLPNDPLPPELLKEAEKQFAQNNNQNDRKKQYQDLIDQGKGLLAQKKVDEAENAFRQALKLFPNDAAALQGIAATADVGKKAKGDVGRAIAQAQAAINANQLPQAMGILRDADKAFPKNSEILRAIQIAELIQANQAAYFQAMARANSFLALRSYGDAILAYSAALRLVPGDPQATLGIIEAQRGFDALTLLKASYDTAVAQGLAFLRAQNYAEAARAFDRALSMVQLPLLLDPQVQSLGRYSLAMAQGNAALAAGQFQQAAQFYQLALVEIPSDIAAQTGMARVRFALSRGRAG